MKKPLFKSIIFLILTFFIVNCSSDDTEVISNANINTTEATAEITFTSMKISGKVISNDGNQITAQGICWSKNPNPTINNEKITESTSTFSSVVSDLTVNTNYYFRIFATTSASTTYSRELPLKTLTLEDTLWEFTITDHNGTPLKAKVNFNKDHTTRYEEINCNNCFIPTGTWATEGNKLTYIGENDDPTNSRHVFTGNIMNLIINGTYKHEVDPDGTWSAVLQ